MARMRGICKVEGCEKPVRARGLCGGHYARFRVGRPIDSPIRQWNSARGCKIANCNGIHEGLGYCDLHYQRFKSGRDLEGPVAVRSPRRPGEWGNWLTTKDGYRYRIRTIDGVQEKQLQHRLVMSEMIGRELLPEENVHHLNGVRDDNRPENLELWNTSQPAGQRIEDKVSWAHHILDLYEVSHW